MLDLADTFYNPVIFWSPRAFKLTWEDRICYQNVQDSNRTFFAEEATVLEARTKSTALQGIVCATDMLYNIFSTLRADEMDFRKNLKF